MSSHFGLNSSSLCLKPKKQICDEVMKLVDGCHKNFTSRTFLFVPHIHESMLPACGFELTTFQFESSCTAIFSILFLAVQCIIWLAQTGLHRILRKTPAANYIKPLQACIYKSVKTELLLTSLVATNIVRFMILLCSTP